MSMAVEGCDYVRVDHDGGMLACLVIDRPHKRNALDRAGWHALGTALTRLGADRNLRCLIVTGVPGAFCAGDDIPAFAAVQDDAVARQGYWDTIMRCYAAISAVPVPVIAAIDGPCIGGGCTLALRADFRIAGPEASFAVPPARLGLVYPADSTALLAHVVGDSFARYMLYSGQRIGAERAVSTGLAMDAGASSGLAMARELAMEFAHSAPLSVRASKLVLNAVAAGKLDQVRDEVELLSHLAEQSADRREGTAAFKAKRLPKFSGN
ncbi:enoyl-CoA hydratase/isomerase family protein [Frigidibacter mobilis]|nr:enoyl-CoA hydratase/isomerase family protein [Frigidibacter mobilis]